MELTKILSISGRPGLYKHIAQSGKGIVVESLNDGSRTTAFPSEHVSSLQDIAIFTYGEDKPLWELFQDIYRKEDGGKAISHKSSGDELKAYFEEVLPDYDKERVYVSNIKRVLQWYNMLIDKELIDLEIPESVKEAEEAEAKAQKENETGSEDNTENNDESPEEENKDEA
jgi:cobalamin biosynthesis protein CobT